jgi:hypothetical protein
MHRYFSDSARLRERHFRPALSWDTRAQTNAFRAMPAPDGVRQVRLLRPLAVQARRSCPKRETAIQRMWDEVTLTDDERAAVDGNQVAVDRLDDLLADSSTPARLAARVLSQDFDRPAEQMPAAERRSCPLSGSGSGLVFANRGFALGDGGEGRLPSASSGRLTGLFRGAVGFEGCTECCLAGTEPGEQGPCLLSLRQCNQQVGRDHLRPLVL